MSRGMYNQMLPEWMQDFGAVNGVWLYTGITDSEGYKIKYQDTEFEFEELEAGSTDEIAKVLSGDTEILEEILDRTSYHLDRDRRSNPVIVR